MSKSDGKIYITISDERGKSGNVPSDIPNPESTPTTNSAITAEESKKNSLLNDYVKHRMFEIAKSSAVTMVNYGISQIGNLTGEYEAQRQVTVVKSIATKAIGYGMAAKAGLTAGGPWGAAIAVAGMATMDIINVNLQTRTEQISNSRQNFAYEQMRIRAGLDSTTNGSRGTES